MNVSSEIALENAFSMAGRVAVVTGGASGLGRGTAEMLAAAGASVVLADVDEQGLEQTAHAIEAAGGRALAHPTNVADLADLEALADATLREFGGLDTWINCAGVTLWSGVLDSEPSAVQRVVSINMLGTFWGCVTAGKVMRKQGRGGTIVNVSSTAGDSPVANLSVYGMTKAGVNQLTRVTAQELGPFGIRVNAVIPGWFDTPINRGMYVDADGN
ncbi:MAG: SDR family oxidoreductase, partial [Sphingomonadales bacterium]|nr:SDR family oxidoreductase [Sphingomonadales bacterium]